MKLTWHNAALRGKRIRTLIVDDSPEFRKSARAFLESLAGIETIGAVSSGAAALEWVIHESPDLLLIDLQMPELNGLETMDRLRSVNAQARVIILTVYDGNAVRAECLARGADAFVSKHRMREELPAILERLFFLTHRADGAKADRHTF